MPKFRVTVPVIIYVSQTVDVDSAADAARAVDTSVLYAAAANGLSAVRSVRIEHTGPGAREIEDNAVTEKAD